MREGGGKKGDGISSLKRERGVYKFELYSNLGQMVAEVLPTVTLIWDSIKQYIS